MPLTIDNSPELLSEAIDMATQKTQRVKVIRAFRHKGEICGIGSCLDLPASVAAELRAAHKVELVQSDTKLRTVDTVEPVKPASQPADNDKKAPASADGDKKGKAA